MRHAIRVSEGAPVRTAGVVKGEPEQAQHDPGRDTPSGAEPRW